MANLINLLIELILVVIMFSVGLSLTANNFYEVIKHPKPLLVGLTAQILLLPLIALVFCIGIFPNMTSEWKIGLFVLSLCPGGVTSNFISYMLKGNTELSVSLTTFNSLLTLFTIPLFCSFIIWYEAFAYDGFIDLSMSSIVFQLILLTTLPALVGVITKRFIPTFAEKIQRTFELKLISKSFTLSYIKVFTAMLLGIMFVIKFFASESSGGIGLSSDDILALLPITLLFNLTCLLLAYLISTLFKLNNTNAMTISIEVGLQNTTLSFLVIGLMMNSTTMQQPPLVYAMFSFWTALLFGVIVKSLKRN